MNFKEIEEIHQKFVSFKVRTKSLNFVSAIAEFIQTRFSSELVFYFISAMAKTVRFVGFDLEHTLRLHVFTNGGATRNARESSSF